MKKLMCVLSVLLMHSALFAELPEYLTFDVTRKGKATKTVQFYKHTLRSNSVK